MTKQIKSDRAWGGKIIQTGEISERPKGSQSGVTNFRYEYSQDSYRVFHNGCLARAQPIESHGLGHVEK